MDIALVLDAYSLRSSVGVVVPFLFAKNLDDLDTGVSSTARH